MGCGALNPASAIRTGLACFIALFLPISVWACSPDSVQVRGPFGQARFSVELADDHDSRAQGLMFRDELALSAGMLFVYERPQELSFWMRNTRIPLDMIFIDSAGVVQHVHENAIPFDETPNRGGRGIAVLEINGGLAARLGIAKGAEIKHPAFASENASWPCAE